MSTAGHTAASSTECCAAQVGSAHEGLPNRSRTAVAVAESGFQVATAPSPAGMVPGETKALDRKPMGQNSTCTDTADSGVSSRSPR